MWQLFSPVQQKWRLCSTKLHFPAPQPDAKNLESLELGRAEDSIITTATYGGVTYQVNIDGEDVAVIDEHQGGPHPKMTSWEPVIGVYGSGLLARVLLGLGITPYSRMSIGENV